MANIQSTLKSGDTEEWLDIVWTRPIGYRWALLFNKFDVHPNTVTVISMVLGALAGLFFSQGSYATQGLEGLIYNICAVCLLAWANFYDSCDGQLARMTGKKTRLGRILDGAAGDIWFLSIYFALVYRMWNQPIPFTDTTWGVWGFLLCCVCGFLCHGKQCRLADYYRNIHLFFLKGKAGSELDNYKQQKQIYENTPWGEDIIWKFFLWTYVNYTKGQEKETPNFQQLMKTLRATFGDDIPQDFRDQFRTYSLPMMKWANILTFNTRAIALYISCLIDMPWIYLIFELVVLTSLYFYMRYTHESFCKKLNNELIHHN